MAHGPPLYLTYQLREKCMTNHGCGNFEDLYLALNAEPDLAKRQELLAKMESAMRAWEETLLTWLSPAELKRLHSDRMRDFQASA